MSKQFVDPLVAENAKLREIVESQQKMIHERMAMDPRYILINDVFVNADDEDEGFCNKCYCWEPICKFLEDDKIQQPCKACYIHPDDISVLDEDVTANIMDAFKQFLSKQKGFEVIENSDNKYGYNCDFVIIEGACPMKYDKKQGWINCNKCILNYDCEHRGTQKFRDLLKTYNCRGDWLSAGQFGVWIKK